MRTRIRIFPVFGPFPNLEENPKNQVDSEIFTGHVLRIPPNIDPETSFLGSLKLKLPGWGQGHVQA